MIGYMNQKNLIKSSILWASHRPLRMEVLNVLFQIAFTLYIFTLFQYEINDDISNYEILLKNFWSIYICRNVEGLFCYHTLNNVFFLPNLGNLIMLTNGYRNRVLSDNGKKCNQKAQRRKKRS